MRAFSAPITWLCLGVAASVASGCTPGASPAGDVHVIYVPDGGTVPDAEIDDEGTIHLAYLAADNIYYVRSADGGQTFSDPIRVNTEAGFASGGRYRGPDLAVGETGLVHVVWYNAAYQQGRPRNEWGVMYARLRPGERVFEPSRNLNHLPSDNYALAADGQGTVAVVWMAENVFVSRSEDGGDSFAAPLKLDANPCECCGSRAVFSQQGNLAVLYRDKTDNIRDMYLAIWPGREAAFRYVKLSETPWPIDACPMTGGFLQSDEQGLIAAWETLGEVYFSRLDGHGRPMDPGEIRVAERGKYPVVLSAPNGTILVAWKQGSQLVWQRFGAGGIAHGRRDSTRSNHPDRPAGLVTETGHFVLFP